MQGDQMQSNVDWPSIRAEFEQGLSQRSLALKYGVSQAAISKRANKERWVITPVIMPQPEVISDNQELEPEIASLLQAALQGLAQLTPQEFTLKEQKLFADALSQYNKIKLTLPPEEQDLSQYDLRLLLADATPEELSIVQPVFATIDARRKPLKRTG